MRCIHCDMRLSGTFCVLCDRPAAPHEGAICRSDGILYRYTDGAWGTNDVAGTAARPWRKRIERIRAMRLKNDTDTRLAYDAMYLHYGAGDAALEARSDVIDEIIALLEESE